MVITARCGDPPRTDRFTCDAFKLQWCIQCIHSWHHWLLFNVHISTKKFEKKKIKTNKSKIAFLFSGTSSQTHAHVHITPMMQWISCAFDEWKNFGCLIAHRRIGNTTNALAGHSRLVYHLILFSFGLRLQRRERCTRLDEWQMKKTFNDSPSLWQLYRSITQFGSQRWTNTKRER